MGHIQHELKLSDIPTNSFMDLTFEHNYIEHLFTRKDEMNLFSIIKLMEQISILTGREFAADMYYSINTSPAKRFKVPYYAVMVPEQGSEAAVQRPTFSDETTWNSLGYDLEVQRQGVPFLIPVVHLHTHPQSFVKPSTNDMEFSTNVYEMPDKGPDIQLKGSPLEIILPGVKKHHQRNYFFFRYTGYQRDPQHWNWVDETLTEFGKRFEETDLKSPEEYAQMMNDSKMFKAFCFSERKNHRRLDKTIIKEMAEFFCPFTLQVSNAGYENQIR